MSLLRNFSLTASMLALVAAGIPQPAASAICTWNGGTGQWSPAGGWSGCLVPGAGDMVSITSAGSVVNITNFSADAATLDLAATNQLNLSNSALVIHNNAVTNNGTINITNTSDFRSASGTVTFGGTGQIVLGDQAGNRLYSGGFAFGAGQTVRGGGSIGLNQTIVTNNGVISADIATRSLDLDVTGGSGGVGAGNGVGTNGNAGLFNTGTLQATGGATLNFASGQYENSATGVIQALAGSIVALGADSRIVGGTLASVGSGRIDAVGTTQYLTSVTLSSGSNLVVRNNDLVVGTSLVNDGTITIGGTAGTANLRAENALTISGAGTIVLDDSLGAARLYGSAITFGSDQSVRGAGSLGINQTIITNNGVFSANSGSSLSIDATGGSGGVGVGNGVGVTASAGLLNNNIIEATGGSAISFESGRYENAPAGVIRATSGSVVALNADSRIVGGTLTSDATSQINAFGTQQYLTDVTLSAGSRLSVQNDFLLADTTLTNNGTITIGGAAGTADLRAETATLAINGTGTIVLDSSQGAARLFGGNITFGAGQTVQGAGQLGVNQTLFTINNVFSANAGSNLSIDVTGGNGGVGAGNGVGANTSAGLYNTSTIQATGGSTVSFESGNYENSAGGVIQALAGSIVALNADSRIVGGTLTSVGTGVINAHGTQQYLTGVTVSAGSNVSVQNDFLLAADTLVNNGTITLGGAVGTADLRAETATLTISGTGTIVLDSSQGAARVFGNRITFGSNQSLRGAGQLGVNQTIIVNDGLFSANSGSNLSIDTTGGSGGVGSGNGVGTSTASGLLNNNIIEATGNSSISFESGLYENAAGAVIRAVNNSIVALNSDSRIVGGTLTSDATSQINAHFAQQYLTDVTLSAGSRLSVQNDFLLVSNTLVNNGTITIGGVPGTADLRAETATLTISGTGTIVLDDSQGAARILANRIVFDSDQSVRGAGQIGVNQTILVNNGLFSANSGSNLSIDVSSGSGGTGMGGGVGTNTASGLLNNNVIEATGNSTVSFESGLYENAAGGIIRAVNGSTVALNNDSRIVGGTLTSDATSRIDAHGTTQYLTSVTLSSGSRLSVQNDFLLVNTRLTNDGTITIGGTAGTADLRPESAILIIDGGGTLVLDNSLGAARIFANSVTFGATQTVRGAGQIGVNQTLVTNNGLISADAGGGISIDVTAGSGGTGAGNGVGSNSASGLVNTGTIEGNGGALALESGRYENSASGTFATGATGSFTMNGDASLFNLKAGGVLDQGIYRSAGGVLSLRGAGTNSIVTIGTAAAGTDTVVTLSGPGSTIRVLNFSSDVPTAIDASLHTVAQSGRLEVLAGRSLTIVANGGTFTNSGIVQIAGGTVGAASYLNNGETFGFGTLAAPVFSSGLVRSAGGTLTASFVVGSGTIQTDAGSTLGLGNSSTAGILNNNGTLALGANDITIDLDYTNANFGSGNAFNARANVTGTGPILATDATQVVTAAGLTGNTLDVGNIRVGGASSTALTITNNGTLTTLRGAVQNNAAPGVSISAADFVVGPSGGSAIAFVNFAGVAAGSLAGQSISVVNNFDNVADTTLDLDGAAYNSAIGTVTPDPVNLGNFRVGTAASGVISINNTAAAGPFSEGLRVTGTATTGGASVGGVTAGLIVAGGSDAATVSLSTATAGARSGTVTFDFATDGAGTSGLAAAAIASDSVTVNANVFALANPFIASPLQFGNVLQGTVQTRSLTVENRLLPGVLAAFQEGLNAAFGLLGGDVQSADGAITNLAAGGTDTTTLTITLNTASAGAKSGTAQILLQSNGAGTSGLGNLDLAPQTVTVLGQVDTNGSVYRLAQAGLAPTTIAFGSRRVGDAAPAAQVLTITNTAAADGFSESLDAARGATTGRATAAGGPVMLLAAGASSTAISVGVDTSVAGANGTVTIDFASNGAGTSGLGITALPSQVVTLGGGVYQAAIAAAQPASLTLAARRVGDSAASATLTVANAAPGTGGFTEALAATASPTAGFLVNGGGSATTANLAPGASEAVGVSRGTATAGSFTGTVTIANTSVAVAGSGLADLALASQAVTVNANVYAAAVANLSTTSVDFGPVRRGAADPTATVGVTNGATGALTDTLVTSVGATPAGVSGVAPGALAAGASGNAVFTLDTAVAGVVSGGGSLDFVSSDPELANLALLSQTINFTGTVTEAAVARLYNAGGVGSFAGGGAAYTLNFGSVAEGTGSVQTDIGVVNDILSSAFAEMLGGSFAGGSGDGFSLGANTFAGLAGGASDTGNLLSFAYTGLAAGNYSRVYTFNGLSSFVGLGDLALGPIQLTVSAQVTAAGAVPEPAIWAQMILGFGVAGLVVRQRRSIAKSRAAC